MGSRIEDHKCEECLVSPARDNRTYNLVYMPDRKKFWCEACLVARLGLTDRQFQDQYFYLKTPRRT